MHLPILSTAARSWAALPLATTWLLAALVSVAAPAPPAPSAGLVLWDLGASPASMVDFAARGGWQAVPHELLALEKNPAKASSDPGYYGRDFVFRGDAVLETPRYRVRFSRERHEIQVFGALPNDSTPVPEVVATAFGPNADTPGTARLELIRHAGDEVRLRLAWGPESGASGAELTCTLDATGILELQTSGDRTGVRLTAPLEYGVVPAFIGDDLVFPAAAISELTHLPSELALVGLLKGGATTLLLSWPSAEQSVTMQGPGRGARPEATTRLEIGSGSRSVFLALESAPGIWFRQPLTAKQLEQDVALDWQRPFPARWKTQLLEEGVRTTFTFREDKGEIWRGVPGSYDYPAWFAGPRAFLHPSKKVPPKGEAVIYFLEGQGTPLATLTPAAFLKTTLGRSAAEALIDTSGRKLRTHHRRGGEGVRRACTCGCTEAIQAVFESKEEVARREEIRAALDDMKFFVACHLERIEEYLKFAANLQSQLEVWARQTPSLQKYLGGLQEILAQIPEECAVQKENMKSLKHADELTQRTLALTARQDPTNLKAYMELLKAWREMGGAQDYVVARCHMLTRKLQQEAGYTATGDARAAQLAREIRQRCRATLRNPDGYEIWAEY